MPMTPFQEEAALPPVWSSDGYNDARIRWYLNLCQNTDPRFAENADMTCEFVAAMLVESGLDNLVIGNNGKNGANNPWLGIGWCQLDTGYHVSDLDFMHQLREDPKVSLDYILGTPDLCHVGKASIHFNRQRWHAWKPEKIDPDNPTAWNPLASVKQAWEALASL